MTDVARGDGADEGAEGEEERVVPGGEDEDLALGLEANLARGVGEQQRGLDRLGAHPLAQVGDGEVDLLERGVNLDELRFVGRAAEVPADALGDGGPVFLERGPEALELLPAIGGAGVRDVATRGRLEIEEPANLSAPVLRRTHSMACLMPAPALAPRGTMRPTVNLESPGLPDSRG